MNSHTTTHVSIALLIFSSSLLLLSPPATSLTHIYTSCSLISDIFFSTDPFKENRDLVLSELTNQSSISTFYHTSAGTVGTTGRPDKAYGLYYCRADVSSSDCQACVQAAANESISTCLIHTEVTTWYEECTLRYSNHTMFKTYEELPWVTYYYPNDNSLDQTKYYSVMETTMTSLITEALDSTSLYATGEGKVSTFETVYCFVQCRPDTSTSDCEECLNLALTNSTTYSHSRRVAKYHVNCQFRYDYKPFLEGIGTSPSPPSDVPSPPDSSNEPSPPDSTFPTTPSAPDRFPSSPTTRENPSPDHHVPIYPFHPSGANSLTGGLLSLIQINTSVAALILLFMLTMK